MSRLKIPTIRPTASIEGTRSRGYPRKRPPHTGLFGVLVLLAACVSGTVGAPAPRPIIIRSGARMRVEQERMDTINEWVSREQDNIRDDPSFWVITESNQAEVYPWDDLRISNDSVWVQVPRGAGDAEYIYHIYAHLHLMVTMGRQEEWLPEAPDAVEFDLERAILVRTADAWILGRASFDFAAFGPLDELAYSQEAEFLDAFIFTARPSEFAVTRAAWARSNSGEMERYRDWFIETFNQEPPGLRPG